MKTFYQFLTDAEWGSQNVWLSEQKRKKKKELEKRMSDAYQKRQRQIKIQKLVDMESHWTGLR